MTSSPSAACDDLRAGEEHPRRLGHDDEVGERRRVGAAAGRDAGDDRDLRDLRGESSTLRAEDPPVAGERRVALLQPGAAGLDEADHRRAGARRRARITRTIESACASPSEPPMKARVLGVAEDRPAADSPGARDDAVARPGALAEPRRDAPPCAAARSVPGSQSSSSRSSGGRGQRLGRTSARLDQRSSAHSAPRQRTALWPPKPNEFEIATRGSGRRRCPAVSARALAGDVVEVELRVALLPADGRRRDSRGAAPRPWRSPRPRPAAPSRCPIADLVERDRDARAARSPSASLQRLGLGAVVERRRGAVGVDVVDVAPARARRRRARARSPAPPRGPSARARSGGGRPSVAA